MISLAFCLAGLAVLVAAALCGHRWPFHWRLPLVVMGPWLALAAFQLAQPPTGWPTPVRPPAGAGFVGDYVREPDPSRHDPGEIDLWLTPAGATRPRAYRLPYTRQLHRQLLTAQGAQKHGVRLRVKPHGHGRAGSSRGQYVFYKEPPAVLPVKTH